MKENLKISLLQFDIAWEDPDENRRRIEMLLSDAGEHGSDLMILPEMFSTGFSTQGGGLAETMNGDSVSWMLEQARKWNTTILGSLIIDDQGVRNRAIAASPKGIVFTYDKRHLFTHAGEHHNFNRGAMRNILEIEGWKIFPQICYDLRFPVWSRNNLGYDLLVYMANWPSRRTQAWNQLLKARAIENLSYVAAVNRVGLDGVDIYYSGESQVLDFGGDQICYLGASEGVLQAVLVKSELSEFRNKFSFLSDMDSFEVHS